MQWECCSYFLHCGHVICPRVSSFRCYLSFQSKLYSGTFTVYLAVYSCRTESCWEQKVTCHTPILGFVFVSSSISTSLCFYPEALSFRPLETENTSLVHKLWWVCLALLSIGLPYPEFPLFFHLVGLYCSTTSRPFPWCDFYLKSLSKSIKRI